MYECRFFLAVIEPLLPMFLWSSFKKEKDNFPLIMVSILLLLAMPVQVAIFQMMLTVGCTEFIYAKRLLTVQLALCILIFSFSIRSKYIGC